MRHLGSLLSLASSLAGAYAISVEPGSLRSNGAIAPISVDTAQPRLTWRLASTIRGDNQTAYQIQAASSKSQVASPDLWDSGRVASTDAFAVYNGRALASRSAVFYRVRVWDVKGSASEWSDISTFEISLLSSSDWKASWITNPQFATGTNSLPLFAKEFDISCPVTKGRLYLLGLGVQAAELNGQKVGDDILMQGYTTVNKTLLYSTYGM